jgi:hypothetical protein
MPGRSSSREGCIEEGGLGDTIAMPGVGTGGEFQTAGSSRVTSARSELSRMLHLALLPHPVAVFMRQLYL